MAKVDFKPGNMLYPLPVVLVSVADGKGNDNILTIAWTGTICSDPAMVSISVRKERYSYPMIKETGEFVINLTTSAMCRETDFCGVKSGKNTDKFGKCGFHPLPAQKVGAPIIEECPVSLECRVTESKLLGSHTMFLAEIVGIDVDEKYIDSKGKLNLQQCGLMAYAHGEYFALGRKLGDFGWSVRKKKKTKKPNDPR